MSLSPMGKARDALFVAICSVGALGIFVWILCDILTSTGVTLTLGVTILGLGVLTFLTIAVTSGSLYLRLRRKSRERGAK